MKASTYRYVTTASCVVLGLMLLPVIVGVHAMLSQNPPMPPDTRTDVHPLFLVGIGKILETTAFEVIADTFASRDPFLSHRIYRKAEMIAENLVEIDVVCESDEMKIQVYQMFEARPWCEIWIYGIEYSPMDDLNFTLLVYRQSEDDVRGYLARLEAGERFDWQEKIVAYRLKQKETEGRLTTDSE